MWWHSFYNYSTSWWCTHLCNGGPFAMDMYKNINIYIYIYTLHAIAIMIEGIFPKYHSICILPDLKYTWAPVLLYAWFQWLAVLQKLMRISVIFPYLGFSCTFYLLVASCHRIKDTWWRNATELMTVPSGGCSQWLVGLPDFPVVAAPSVCQ